MDSTERPRSTSDGIDLVKNITRDGTVLVNYSYLADGTKAEAKRFQTGKWLIYRGPFVYRMNTTGNSAYPESVEFSGGRVTRTGAMIHVKDYLGSVRAVIDGRTGAIFKAADYSAFGAESPAGSMQIAAIPNNAHPLTTITLRDGYTGKEDQTPEFGTGYIDFGARQYSPALRRWMTQDPLAEKLYGTSPYAFCNNNPVNFVDPDGEIPIAANLIGGAASVLVEYTGQVIGRAFQDRKITLDTFTDVDVADLSIAFVEGFVSSGTNIVKKIATKTAVGIAGEVIRNTVDIKFEDGRIQKPTVNQGAEVVVNSAIGLTLGSVKTDAEVKIFKGTSRNQARIKAREMSYSKGNRHTALESNKAAKEVELKNIVKKDANNALSDIVNSSSSSLFSEGLLGYLWRIEDEND